MIKIDNSKAKTFIRQRLDEYREAFEQNQKRNSEMFDRRFLNRELEMALSRLDPESQKPYLEIFKGLEMRFLHKDKKLIRELEKLEKVLIDFLNL